MIKPGRFERSADCKFYAARLHYAEELRKFVYNPAVLNDILCSKELKETFFRCFGYAGNLDFTLYPGAWLRDLPLLSIGQRVYFGDQVLLGTNRIAPDQKTVTVGPITVGDNSIFDQRCAIALGSIIGESCQFGFEVSIGMGCEIGDHVRLREITKIGNKTTIGTGAKIGQVCSVGDFCIIEPGVDIPDHQSIPAFSVVSKNGITSRRGRKGLIRSSTSSPVIHSYY